MPTPILTVVPASTEPEPLTEVGSLPEADAASKLDAAGKASANKIADTASQQLTATQQKLNALKASITTVQGHTNVSAMSTNETAKANSSVFNNTGIPNITSIFTPTVLNQSRTNTFKTRVNALKYRVNSAALDYINKQHAQNEHDIYVTTEVKKVTTG